MHGRREPPHDLTGVNDQKLGQLPTGQVVDHSGLRSRCEHRVEKVVAIVPLATQCHVEDTRACLPRIVGDVMHDYPGVAMNRPAHTGCKVFQCATRARHQE